jgi:hypothetical protein
MKHLNSIWPGLGFVCSFAIVAASMFRPPKTGTKRKASRSR